MAGDWIKMRAELATHPRFLSLCSELIFGENCGGFLAYVCGEEVLGIGAYPPSEQSVTERALRCVTERALRDVALTLLLRVWCAVNSHCKVDGHDAVMTPMGTFQVDEIAGCGWFGHAMLAVGWIVEREPNSLVFPNFLEYNEPACIRRAPLSNAERQARFRSKMASGKTRVTRSNESNGREEKRREENKNPPKPPQGGAASNDAPPANGTHKTARPRAARRSATPTQDAIDRVFPVGGDA